MTRTGHRACRTTDSAVFRQGRLLLNNAALTTSLMASEHVAAAISTKAVWCHGTGVNPRNADDCQHRAGENGVGVLLEDLVRPVLLPSGIDRFARKAGVGERTCCRTEITDG
jgi:hypothetical protein